MVLFTLLVLHARHFSAYGLRGVKITVHFFFLILKREEEWICRSRALTNELVRRESCVLRVNVHYLALALFVRWGSWQRVHIDVVDYIVVYGDLLRQFRVTGGRCGGFGCYDLVGRRWPDMTSGSGAQCRWNHALHRWLATSQTLLTSFVCLLKMLQGMNTCFTHLCCKLFCSIVKCLRVGDSFVVPDVCVIGFWPVNWSNHQLI